MDGKNLDLEALKTALEKGTKTSLLPGTQQMSESIVYKITKDDNTVIYVYASGLTNLLNDPISRGREFRIETLGPDRPELWVKQRR